ncbi:unnamed protein product [Rhizoctonia solani]|uniref:Peptidase C14 caspase domain-containing protein n=1 Tax=Rhizoctonia solani TaxID=456999 RepID=A0A8H3B465_9AGAM|nr:unnamed protein product [Rhizoctonia solani]
MNESNLNSDSLSPAVPRNRARGLTKPPSPQVLADLEAAMTKGSILTYPVNNSVPPTPAKRRALIIAPRYRDQEDYATLNGTPIDALNVYNMLIESSYEPQNIRILCDSFIPINLGEIAPNVDNIRLSLDWLVRGTRPGDYRFLHFTGHGDRAICANPSTGKETRRVWTPKPTIYVLGDYENSNKLPTSEQYRRISKMEIDKKDLVYYNEVLITTARPRMDTEEGDSPYVREIWDNELNKCLSKLPKGSVITCLIDCCASGRILNLDIKLEGAGHKGRTSGPIAQPPPAPEENRPLKLHHDSEGVSYIKHPSLEESEIRGEEPKIIYSDASTKLEVELNSIQAQVFAWKACHQRQWAYETDDGGLLTHVCLPQAGYFERR